MSTKKEIALYPGPDISPTRMMSLLEEAAQHEGYEANMLPGHNEDHDDLTLYNEEVQRSAALVVGFSHDHSGENEHNAPQRQLVADLGTDAPPIIFMEDVPGVATQYENMRDIAPNAQLISVTGGRKDQPPTHAQEDFGWDTVHRITYPPHWKNIMDSMQQGSHLRENECLLVRPYGADAEVDATPLPKDTPVVSVIGYKRHEVELALLQAAKAHCDAQFGTGNYVLHYRPDMRKPATQAIQTQIDDVLKEVHQIVDTADGDDINTEMIMGASDVCFTHPGSSSINVLGPLRRANTVSVMAYVDAAASATNFDYRETGELHTHVIEDAMQVGNAIDYVRSDAGRQAITAKQTVKFESMPADWDPGAELLEKVETSIAGK